MNKNQQQHQIRKQEQADTEATNDWLKEQGVDANTFGSVHIRLIQAQRQAHQLLTHHGNLLTKSQQGTLENFMQQMSGKHTRNRLKPQAATPVLNISSKVNRQLFRQLRQTTQA
jgi:hypothetical protein